MLPDQRPTTWTFHTAWAVYDTGGSATSTTPTAFRGGSVVEGVLAREHQRPGARAIVYLSGGHGVLFHLAATNNSHSPNASIKASPPISRIGLSGDHVLRFHS